MSTASPTAFLLWAVLSVLFLGFLVFHLWSYDRFQCLRWSAGRQPGAFKRVMTYSYLASVPLLVLFSVATTVIKFREGFITVDGPRGFRSIIPRPIDLYSPQAKAWVLPLDFVFSIAWSFELVTHLEELAFWLYLLHQDPQKEEWFSSWEYRLWYMGSMVAIIGMPLTALITRNDIVTCDAYIFLVGASGSTLTTICFIYVLWRFPAFIRQVKTGGADPTVVVRLATFYQLNLFRVVFRFLFTLPLLVLSLDGIIEGSHPVNRSLFWTDFLVMIAGIGCFVSTTITLLIFFPRSIIKEAGYRPKAPTLPNSPKTPTSATPPSVALRFGHSHPQQSHFFPTPTVAINPMPPFIQTPPPISPPLTQEFSTEDDWETDDDCSSTGDHNMYRETDQVPPYPQSASSHTHSHPVPSQPPNPTSFPSSPVSSPPRSPPLHPSPPNEHVSIPMQFHHILPEQIPYQRHPFPHSLSSPQILSSAAPSSSTTLAPSPASPPQLRIPDGRVRHTRSHTHTRRPSHHRHHSRRVSASAAVGASGVNGPPPADDTQAASAHVGLGFVSGFGVDHRGQGREGEHQMTSVGRPAPPPTLHPYVMTFTSPIDLIDIPPREDFPHAVT